MGRTSRTHPGTVLRRDFLEERQISATDLADGIDVHVTQITGILAGRRAISGDLATQFARYFSTSAEFWTSLQGSYDRGLMSQASKKRGIRRPKLPTRRR